MKVPVLRASFLVVAILAIVGLAGWRFGERSSPQATPPFNSAPAVCMQDAHLTAGRAFHVDPVNGDDSGDGSSTRPWRSLQLIADAGLIGDQTRSVSRVDRAIAKLLGKPVAVQTANNPKVRVRGGDTIVLHAGDYGSLRLSGIANFKPLTMAAAPGENVRFSHIALNGVSGMKFHGIVVEGPKPSAAPHLVTLRPMPDAMRSQNIWFSGMRIGSTSRISGETKTEWAGSSPDGVLLFGDCLTLRHSRVHDVHNGISLYQVRNTLVDNAEIEDFSVDGIDFSGRDIVIANNTIRHHWPTGDDLHPDCMQGQSTPDMPVYGPVRIENNICLSDTVERHSQTLQGINIFDGRWSDVAIRCNFVRPTIQHGISLYGVKRATIESNFVIGWPGNVFPWIAAFPAKDGTHPVGNIIRTNVATGYINALQNGPDDTLTFMEAMRINPADAGLRAVLKSPIRGVSLSDNTVIAPGPDLSHDAGFQMRDTGIERPISVTEAKSLIGSLPGCQG